MRKRRLKHKFIVRIGKQYFSAEPAAWVNDRNEASRFSLKEARIYAKDWAAYNVEVLYVLD